MSRALSQRERSRRYIENGVAVSRAPSRRRWLAFATVIGLLAATLTLAPPAHSARKHGHRTARMIALDAIHHAAARYHVSEREMRSVAECESGLNPRDVEPTSGAAGLLQLLPSTFAGTPFRRQWILGAYANANAAAWLYNHDGRSWREWVCQP